MIVMGVDAGKSTGWAVLDFDFLEDEPAQLVQWGLFKDTHAKTAKRLYSIILSIWPDVVAVERFDLRPNQFVANLDTVYINGALEYLNEVDSLPKLVWQTPGQAKGLIPDKGAGKNRALKRLGLYPAGQDVGQPDANDVRDAIRHALFYGVTVLKHRPTIEKGWS